jgi:predicted acyltransferase
MVSLDIFRGMTIAAMILVNDPGTWSAIYWPLDHAEWNGWTPTDLIFPFFLFIVGVSMTLSFAARLRRGATRGQLARHVAIRSLAIFAIGLFLNGFPYFHLATIRYAGVLQRIAVCYLIAGLLVLATAKRADREAFQARIGVIAAVIAALLIGYWALMRFVPVPGYGVGRLDPDGNLAAHVGPGRISEHDSSDRHRAFRRAGRRMAAKRAHTAAQVRRNGHRRRCCSCCGPPIASVLSDQ